MTNRRVASPPAGSTFPPLVRLRLHPLARVRDPDGNTCQVLLGDAVVTLRDPASTAVVRAAHERLFHDGAPYVEVDSDSGPLASLLDAGLLLTDRYDPGEATALLRELANPNLASVQVPAEDVLAWTRAAQPVVRDAPDRPPAGARASCRTFAADGRVARGTLADLCRAAYGITWQERTAARVAHGPVASAGGFYPLRLCCWERKETTFARLDFDRGGDSLRELGAVGSDDLLACFLPDLRAAVAQAAVAVVLVGDFTYAARKYGPRAALYAALEAGAVAHRITDAARQRGLASLQVGGYRDEDLADLLGLDRQVRYPLHVVLLGTDAAPPAPDG